MFHIDNRMHFQQLKYDNEIMNYSDGLHTVNLCEAELLPDHILHHAVELL